MDPVLLKMILLACGIVTMTAAIAKFLRIGSNEFYGEQSDRGQQVGRHCCLSGLADFSEDIRTSRDHQIASGQIGSTQIGSKAPQS